MSTYLAETIVLLQFPIQKCLKAYKLYEELSYID